MALNFALSEEQAIVRQTARDVIARFSSRRAEFVDRIMVHKEFPEELWQALAEAGFLGALIPEEYGGSGMGLLAYAIALEELCSGGYGNALLVVTAMDATCILRNGSEALRQQYLPGIADGSLKFCFALTEPNAGTNSFRLTTQATKDGESYRISGEKTYITGADVAEYMLLATRTTSYEQCREQGLPKAYGLSLFIVPTKAPGVSLHELPTRGIEGFRQFTVVLEDVEVAADQLVGEQDGGFMALLNSLNPERVLAAATACGMTRYLLDRSCEYARDRKVFKDTPIGAYQGIQHPLAEIAIELEAATTLTQKAAWAFDEERSLKEVGATANAAKFLASELAIKAADRAIQTHGGNGFSTEYGVIFFWESARLLRTAPISKEMILNYHAEHVLGLPRSY